MPRIPTDLETMFLRFVEIAEAHVPFLGIASEREALAAKYAEMRTTVLAVREALKRETDGDAEGPTT